MLDGFHQTFKADNYDLCLDATIALKVVHTIATREL